MKAYILIILTALGMFCLGSCDETHKLRGRPIDIYSSDDTTKPVDTALVVKDKLKEPDSSQ